MGPFGLAVDNWAGAVGTAHVAGDGQIVLSALNGLPALPSARIYRMTALANAGTPAESVLGIFEATGLSSLTLTGVTAAAGYSDVNLPAGTVLQIRVCAATIAEIQGAVGTPVSIGTPIGGGVANALLYVTAGGNLGQGMTGSFDGDTLTADQVVVGTSSAGTFWIARRDTALKSWQIMSQAGELTIYNVEAAQAAFAVMASNMVNFYGQVNIAPSASDYSLILSTMGLQFYSVNNCWIGDNLFYDGSQWTYKTTGYGAQLYFSNGGVKFTTAPTLGSGAGITAVTTDVFAVDNVGNTGVLGTLSVTGRISAPGITLPITADTDGGTITFNMAQSDWHSVTLGGARTLAVSNVATNQQFTIILTQDGLGGRTVAWFAGVRWSNNTVPTLTTTPGKSDVFTFKQIAANTYLGFQTGQNM